MALTLTRWRRYHRPISTEDFCVRYRLTNAKGVPIGGADWHLFDRFMHHALNQFERLLAETFLWL